MRWVALLMVLALATAGCTDQDAPAGEEQDDTPDELRSGGLRGVVVDAAIRPLAGALVTILQDQAEVAVLTTDSNGEWGVRDLSAGNATITVAKAGFLSASKSTLVIAGQQVPELLQTILEAAPVDDTTIMSLPWDGVVGCAMGANWCAVVDLYTGVKITNDASGKQFYDEFTEMQRRPDFVQIEVVWEPASLLGTHMSIELWAGNWEQWETFGSEEHYGYTSFVESPLVVSLNATQLASGLVGNETGIGLGLYAGCIPWPGCWAETGPPQAMVNQPFEGFLHAFYGCLPPEGWRFVEHGDAVCAS